MDPREYVFEVGMDETEIREALDRAETGVLALAAGDDAYAFPVAFVYEDETVFLRLGRTSASTKHRYLDRTDTACFTCYDVDADGVSWSVVATGPIEVLPVSDQDRFDEDRVTDEFLDLRVFGEAVEDLEVELYALEVERLVGRRTPGA